MLIDVSVEVSEGMVFRPGSPPVRLDRVKCFGEEEGEYLTTVLSTPTHIGTHIDVVYPERKIELQRLMGVGRLVDVSAIEEGMVALKDVEEEIKIGSGEFVFFMTGWSKYLGTRRYFEHPELSMEVLEWLASKRVNMVGIDALGLGRLKNHSSYDKFLADKNVYIIENLTNLSSINRQPFRVYCFPLKIQGSDALPCRVMVET
ncbi:MAG: cyclase family protein [Candidatus Bathyarchaeia archaeon]